MRKMTYDYGNKDKIKEENSRKYLKPPSSVQIDEFLHELGVTTAAFERFYGIPIGTIRKIRHGDNGRILPMKYWHIIYEKIKPAYGVGFIPTKEEIRYKQSKVEPYKKKVQKPINKKLLERLKEL